MIVLAIITVLIAATLLIPTHWKNLVGTADELYAAGNETFYMPGGMVMVLVKLTKQNKTEGRIGKWRRERISAI